MNNEKLAVRVLGLTALLLLLALVFIPAPATGQVVANSEEFLVATHPANQGGDALYVADLRTGVLGVFIFDNATKSPQLRARIPIADGFGGR